MELLILNLPGHTINLMGKSLVNAILVDIRVVQDTVIRQILSTSANRQEFLDILSHFMAEADVPSISADFRDLCYLFGSRKSAKMVLMKHFHLLVEYYEPFGHAVSYQPLSCLFKFLCNPARGGTLHTQFRSCCIATCTNLVLRISQTIEETRLVLHNIVLYV